MTTSWRNGVLFFSVVIAILALGSGCAEPESIDGDSDADEAAVPP